MIISRRYFLKLGGLLLVSTLIPLEKSAAFSAQIPVLVYHNISHKARDLNTVTPSAFAAQMEWLFSNGYRTLPINGLERHVEDHHAKSLIITFDLGYASFMDYAYPLLYEYNLKATLNVLGKYVGTYIMKNRPMLSWDEYRHIVGQGIVELGCHEHNIRPSLLNGALISDKERTKDLLSFQDLLQSQTGKKTEILTLSSANITPKMMDVARKTGFKYILTSDPQPVHHDRDLYEVPRRIINHTIDLDRFRQSIRKDI